LTLPDPAVVSRFDNKFKPLNWDAVVMPLIWSRSASISDWILTRSTFSSCEATIFSFIWVRRSVTRSDAWRATETVDCPSARLELIALKPLRSDSITLEMAQRAALSLALPTDLPVEIISWVLPKFVLMDFSVCSATMAPLLVRMLDISRVPYDSDGAFAPSVDAAPEGLPRVF